jgi:ADP-heptose:LPS heptosyltransferase
MLDSGSSPSCARFVRNGVPRNHHISSSPIHPQTILVYVGNDLLGDGLIKLPFLRALRSAFPQAHITWLAGRGKSVFAGSLAPLVIGLIDEVVEQAGIDGNAWLPIHAAPLPGRAFDLIVDTQRRVRTTMTLRRIRHRVFVSGTLGWLLSDRRPNSGLRKLPVLAQQLLKLVEAASGAPAQELAPLADDPATEAEARRLLPDLGDGSLYIGLAPGASLPHKLWPLDRFVELAKRLEAKGYAPAFLLGPQERNMIEPIRQRLPHVALPLPEGSTPMLTIAVGRRLAGAITNDSGLGHLMATASVPLVVMFGPTPAAKFIPMTPRYEILRSQDFGGGEDMAAIPADAVWAAFERLVGSAR